MENMKKQLKCILVQKSEGLDVVVFQNESGDAKIAFDEGEGDKFFKAGKSYDFEFKESSVIEQPKKKLILTK